MPQDNVIEAGFVKPEEPVKSTGNDIEYAIAVLHKVRKVLNITVLVFLAAIGALAIFGYAVYDPTTARIIASSLYAAGVLWPAMYLYLKKG